MVLEKVNSPQDLKTLSNEELKTLSDEIKRYVDELLDTGECLNVKSEGVIRKIPISYILYIESKARILILHLKNENVSFYGKLGDIEELLKDRGFLRIHQSYMVKKSAVSCLTGKELVVDDNYLPISRKYYNHIKDCF